MPILYSQNAARHVTFCVHICGEKSTSASMFCRTVTAHVGKCDSLPKSFRRFPFAHSDALHVVGAHESAGGMRNCKEDRQPAAQVFYPPRAPPVFLAYAGGAPRRGEKIRAGQCEHTAHISDSARVERFIYGTALPARIEPEGEARSATLSANRAQPKESGEPRGVENHRGSVGCLSLLLLCARRCAVLYRRS